MFCISLADIVIEIDNRYGYTEKACKNYAVDYACVRPAFRVRATSVEIESRVEQTNKFLSSERAEFYVLFDKICKELPKFDALMLHSSLVSYNGRSYAFCAPRGVGKTTHARLWVERFGSSASILCGDKPIFRKIGGEWYGYGTPWGGKEGDNLNDRAKLGVLFFLERYDTSRTMPISPDEFVQSFISNTVIPNASDVETRTAFCTLLGDLYSSVPRYKLLCTASQDALDAALEKI